MLLRSLLSRLARLSAYKVFLQAPVAFRFFNPCPPFFSSHRLFCSQQHIIYIEATHISTLPAHFFTRNRGGLPGSGATFDASLSSFHAATHFFPSVSLFLYPFVAFTPKNIPHLRFFITRWSLFYRERNYFFSRDKAFFVVIKKLTIRSGVPRSLVFLTFLSTFLAPFWDILPLILPFLHVKFCCPWNYFRFCVKKVCCVFGGKGILFYFCTRFTALWR